ncbi:MFS transporter [Corynebacterium ulceribovis]|uniref:MFS transporter n=1 Tax=Corynebacterium ulceribovis TaxID=487732 RepID=UPI001B7FEB56|nr:MFS transporter [Corynebacterium ulceribovis]
MTDNTNASSAIGPKTWLRVAFTMFVIGFGANLFAPMLQVYRQYDGMSDASVTLMFAVYAAGLVPALIAFGPMSDRLGRRAILRPAVLLSAAGSIILALGVTGVEVLLYIGRWIAGFAVGMAMASGAAWIKQLSLFQPTAGPRRATIAVSAGFGGGPFVAGCVTEFLPFEHVLPFIVHLVLVALVLPWMWTAPETQPRMGTPSDGKARQPRARRVLVPKVTLSSQFLWAVAAWAPWVFGTVTVAFTTLPTQVEVEWPMFFIGAVAFVALGTGVAIQPAAALFLERSRPQWLPLSVLGLGSACAGMLTAAVTVYTQQVWLVFVAAVFLGAAYGVMMVAGLSEVEMLASADDLGALIGVFYALTYIGFFVPFALSLIAPLVGMMTCLLFGAVVCLVSMVPVARVAARAAAG